jgi:hypothetical protein
MTVVKWSRPVPALAVVALAAAASGTPSVAHAPGCWSGRSSPVGSVSHVYLIPHGCTWLGKPRIGHVSIGPQFRTRIHGTDDGAALVRDPMGEAYGVCGFGTFLVTWPRFVVTARRIAWGDGTGCHDLPEGRAVTWEGRFVWRPREGRRPARWEPVLTRSSPPLRRP